MSDRWNEALEAAAKACEKWADKQRFDITHRTDALVAAAMMCSQAILALREADQEGAAMTHYSRGYVAGQEEMLRKTAAICRAVMRDYGPDSAGIVLANIERLPIDGEAEDQRGAAARELPAANSARCDEGNPGLSGTQSLLTSAKQPAQSAPHHPGGPYKARQSTQNNHVAPDYVDGPNGFSVLCYGAWELAKHLNENIAPASPGPMVMVPRDRIEGLLEYWNGNPNERAMLDALTHIQTELQAMLAAAEEARNAT